MTTEEPLLIKDPVHGSIQLDGFLRQIIDTEEFQRLRKIKQLGGACYVYPGATHTRFEHSIGVCYIASELLRVLKPQLEKLDFYTRPAEEINAKTKTGSAKKLEPVTEKLDPAKKLESDIKCVKIAALCHDLGHGPFSHLYDFAAKGPEGANSNKLKRHEYRSVEIFEKKICPKLNVNEKEKTKIGKLITFSEDYKEEAKQQGSKATEKSILAKLEPKIPPEEAFLYEIVANGFTGVDVDKMDYFLRDGYAMGLPSVFDWRRYIQTLKVLETEDGVFHICSRDKEALEIYQLFHIRNQLYRQAYRHKTTVAIEYMLKKALEEANKSLVIKKSENELKILEAWKEMDYFLLLDDTIEDVIMQNPSEQTSEYAFYFLKQQNGIEEARNIIRHIKQRKLIKFIGEKRVTKECCVDYVVEKLVKEAGIDITVTADRGVKSQSAKDAGVDTTVTSHGVKLQSRSTSMKMLLNPEVVDTTVTGRHVKPQSTSVMQIKEAGVDTATVTDRGQSLIIHEEVTFSYGMKEENPVKKCYFFGKEIPPRPRHLTEPEVSEMLPKHFLEKKTMFYYDTTKAPINCDLSAILKELRRIFNEQC